MVIDRFRTLMFRFDAIYIFSVDTNICYPAREFETGSKLEGKYAND
jgi:hypothetical protein